MNRENEEIGQRGEDEMMMEAHPGAALEMIKTEIILGSLEILLDVPTAAAEGQAAGFGGRAVQVGQIIVIRRGGCQRPRRFDPLTAG